MIVPPPDLFSADSGLVDAVHPSPNVNSRRNGKVPQLLILHYTGLESTERSINVLADPICQVSCHYVIDEAGRIVQMVPERSRAWHAGVSKWHCETDLNSVSIGIELQNPGHDAGYPDFPAAQVNAVTKLAQDIMSRHVIPAHGVLAHSDIAPRRKMDPGEKFPWRRLAEDGVGHWVDHASHEAPSRNTERDMEDVRAVQSLLARYGYDCPQSGQLDAETTIVVAAFQRHFRPALVDGQIDAETVATLSLLIEHLPK
ncbi:MAG: N-acetylmuramoyl-L-alanine amidase [Hyphomicrobiaceae bacterium]